MLSVDLRNQNIIFKLYLFMQERWDKNFAFNTLKAATLLVNMLVFCSCQFCFKMKAILFRKFHICINNQDFDYRYAHDGVKD